VNASNVSHACLLTNVALPGMNASGGAAAPLNDASEEFGATAPRNEQFGDDDETSTSNNDVLGSSNAAKNSSSSSNNKSSTSNKHQSSTKSSSGAQSSSGHNTRSSNKEQGKNDLEEVSREKAERYVKLNEEDVDHAGSGNKDSDDAKRSSQRAPRDVGAKDDIEQLHGKASAESTDDKKRGTSGGEQQGGEKSRKQVGSGAGNGKEGSEGHGHEHKHDPMRHNAAKFVNIEE
jgi:hypothetical protein